ncbi:MAG: ABC transporter ATP-binding protein [Acidimicrobiaceae bacterium]|nr:ABC transporter ATP-binding protein [Acidimicrobiaceae bacterium]
MAESSLVLTDVSKSFQHRDGFIHALSKVSFNVRKAEFVSVIGPSGCGKSTLLRLINGLRTPDSGSIVVNGLTPDEARQQKKFAFVPQNPALLPWLTVQQNVSLLNNLNSRAGNPGMAFSDQRQLLKRIGLGSFLNAHPWELSGGLQQRVCIARAFALKAPVLLMDEPFSSLDEITRTDMGYLLLKLWEHSGSTVLFVTHSIPEAVALSDRVVVLTPRPGHVTEIIPVPLSRPRQVSMEDSTAYHQTLTEVRATIAAECSS